jgi:hypothetical protein
VNIVDEHFGKKLDAANFQRTAKFTKNAIRNNHCGRRGDYSPAERLQYASEAGFPLLNELRIFHAKSSIRKIQYATRARAAVEMLG